MSEQQHFGMVAETIYMKREQMPVSPEPVKNEEKPDGSGQ